MWESGKNCSFFVLTSMPPYVINVFALANHLGLFHNLKSVLHARDILKLKATRSGDADDWRNFKKLRNVIISIPLMSTKVIHVTPGQLLTSLCLGIHTILS